MDFEVNEASQMTMSKFKLRAALKLCIDLFLAEWCWTLFSSTNSIINRSSRYFTNLKLKIRKETFTDQIHRDAYLSFKEIFKFFRGIDKSNRFSTVLMRYIYLKWFFLSFTGLNVSIKTLRSRQLIRNSN